MIDTIQAYTLEVGDVIAFDDDEIDITSISDIDDSENIRIEGYSANTGDITSIEVYFAEAIDLLISAK